MTTQLKTQEEYIRFPPALFPSSAAFPTTRPPFGTALGVLLHIIRSTLANSRLKLPR